MPQVIIENPVLNSPYREPTRHFRFTEDGITDDVTDTRRASSYFIPIPAAKKKGKQLQFETEWTESRRPHSSTRSASGSPDGARVATSA